MHFHPQCPSHGKEKERKIRKISSLDDIQVLYMYILHTLKYEKNVKNKSQWKYSLNKNVCNLPKTTSVVQLYVPLMSLIAERHVFGFLHLFTTRRCYWAIRIKTFNFNICGPTTFQYKYCIYSINHPGHLLNVWTLRVGTYSRWALIRGWGLIKFSAFSASVVCLFCNKTINGNDKTRRCNKARFL